MQKSVSNPSSQTDKNLIYMYQCCPHHSGGQNSMEEEITPGQLGAPHCLRTPAVAEQSLKGAGKGAEVLGALYEQESPHAGQRHHQDKMWNLGEQEGHLFCLFGEFAFCFWPNPHFRALLPSWHLNNPKIIFALKSKQKMLQKCAKGLQVGLETICP